MASKKNGAADPPILMLGGKHTIKVRHRIGRKVEVDDDGVETVIDEGTAITIEIDHREARTSERIQYMSKSASVTKKLETEGGLKAILDLRMEYGSKVYLGQRGLGFPEDMSEEEGMKEYGSDFISILARHVFEGEQAAEVSIEDAGKSEKTSAISSKAGSAQSSGASANT